MKTTTNTHPTMKQTIVSLYWKVKMSFVATFTGDATNNQQGAVFLCIVVPALIFLVAYGIGHHTFSAK